VSGIAYMETIVRPFTPADGSSKLRPVLEALRSDEGEELILNQNLFIERVLPNQVLRKLSDLEMAEYRRPFLRSKDRWPIRPPFVGRANAVTVCSSHRHCAQSDREG
jgi:haloalkane dehalogenase